MALPVAYHDAAVIQEVAIDVWREVFEATGWPTSLNAKQTSFGHDDIAHAFQNDPVSDDLLYALQTLHELGTEAGREAIVTAMNDQRIPLDKLPSNSGEREFSLQLFLAQRSDASLVDVFTRAQIQVQETGDQRRYNDFIGKQAQPIARLSTKVEKLRAEVFLHCQKSDLGDHVQVKAFEDDGDFIFNVIRSHHTRKPLAVVSGQTTRAPLQYRPIHGDILRYEATGGRLRIAARAASMVDFYRRTLGAVIFNDPAFFDGRSVCSLEVLRNEGRKVLDNHTVFGIGRVRMTECLWERGDRELLHFRSPDCFSSIEELNLSLAEGSFLQAKLKVEIIGKSTRPVTVNIRVPSKFDVSQQAHEGTVEKLLTAIGIYNSAAPTSAASLWTLYPWRHPIATWRTLFGRETDALANAGILTPIRLDSVSAAENPAAGRALNAHEVTEGEYYGVSQIADVPSRSLSPTDLDGYALAPEEFRSYLRTRLGITRGGSVWDGHETLDLGILQVGDQSIHAVYTLREPPQGIGIQMRGQSGGAPSVLLIPAAQEYSSELSRVVIDSALPTQAEFTRAAISVSGLADTVPAIFTAPNAARLVVDSKLKRIWIDGIEIPGLPPDSHYFRFVEAMARNPLRLSINDLSEMLSPGRDDGNASARQAKTHIKKTITAVMKAAGRTFDEDPFPSAGSGHYRCSLPCSIR